MCFRTQSLLCRPQPILFVCSNMALSGVFTKALARHSKSFSLIDCVSVGVDRMQRKFEPMRKLEQGTQVLV